MFVTSIYFAILLVVDVNDNAPQFMDSPYRFTVDETSKVGEVLFDAVFVKDTDIGSNGIVKLTCVEEESPEACEAFEIKAKVYINSIKFNFLQSNVQ
jgi:hypothetical protein